MATFTPHLNLKKPTQSEFYDIDDHNSNSDLIDASIGVINSTINQIKVDYIKVSHNGDVIITNASKALAMTLNSSGYSYYKSGTSFTEANQMVNFNNTNAVFKYPVIVQGSNIIEELSSRYTKTESDGRYPLASSVYSKVAADDKFATLAGVYSKNDSDVRYPLSANTYVKNEVYSKGEADNRFSQKKIHGGTSAPSNTLGNDGDIYIQYI